MGRRQVRHRRLCEMATKKKAKKGTTHRHWKVCYRVGDADVVPAAPDRPVAADGPEGLGRASFAAVARAAPVTFAARPAEIPSALAGAVREAVLAGVSHRPLIGAMSTLKVRDHAVCAVVCIAEACTVGYTADIHHK